MYIQTLRPINLQFIYQSEKVTATEILQHFVLGKSAITAYIKVAYYEHYKPIGVTKDASHYLHISQENNLAGVIFCER